MSNDQASLIKDALKKIERLKRELADQKRAATCADEIAVIGASCRLPGGVDSLPALWRTLDEGADVSGAVPADRWDNDRYYDPQPGRLGRIYTKRGYFLDDVYSFDNEFFRISTGEARSLDPQQRLLLETSWEVIEDAHIDADSLRGQAVGVYIGLMARDYSVLVTQKGDLDLYAATGNSASVTAGRIAYILGLQGPTLTVDTACSSSLVAAHLACQALRNGECRAALVGGVNLQLSPLVNAAECAGRMIAADGRCKTFDAAADGYVRGDGAAVILLKRLDDARRDGDRILGVILGSSVNHDGASSGLTVPNGNAQISVMKRALECAGMAPERISYVEAHGTGTKLGDPIEMASIESVYCQGRSHERPLLVGSIKSNFGHTEAAAGLLGLLKILVGFRAGQLPRNLHLVVPNPYIPWARLPVRIPLETTPWQRTDAARVAALSSFGVSGTNAHMLIAEPPPSVTPNAAPLPGPPFMLNVSARTPRDLESLIDLYRPLVRRGDLAALCATAATGRKHLAARKSFVAASDDELAAQLAAWRHPASGEAREQAVVLPSPHPLALVLTADDSLALPVADLLQLCRRHVVFRSSFDEADAALRRVEGLPASGTRTPIDLLSATDTMTPVERAGLVFTVEVALATLLTSWRLGPGCVAGIGLGEISAGAVAGILSLTQAAALLWAAVHDAPVALDAGAMGQPRLAFLSTRSKQVDGDDLRSPSYWQSVRPAVRDDSQWAPAMAAAEFRTVVVIGESPGATSGAAPFAGLTLLPVRRKGVPYADGITRTVSALYELGYAINWTEYFGRRAHTELPLPSYPFCGRELRIDLPEIPNHPSGGVASGPPAPQPRISLSPSPSGNSTEELRRQLLADMVRLFSVVMGVAAHKVNLDADLADYGVDSILVKFFSFELGELLHIDVPASVFFQANTLREVGQSLLADFETKIAAAYSGRAAPDSAQAKPPASADAPDPSVAAIDLQDIAIIGMSGRFPGSPTIDDLWDHLVAEHDLVGPVPAQRWRAEEVSTLHPGVAQFGAFIDDADAFDARFFGIAPAEAKCIDPQHRVLLEETWRAIEDAGYAVSSMAGKAVGVFAGVQFVDYDRVLANTDDEVLFGPTGTARSLLTNRISYCLNLRGPSETIDTACSSSLVAIHRAVQALRDGECEVAVAGGVNLILAPDTMIAGSLLKMLSPDGRCKTLDKSANGYVKGEGAAMLVLKPLSRALADRDHVHAIIKGSAVNHGGRARSITAPNPTAQTELLVAAYQRAQVPLESISYVELHGTGTELGDPIEIDALKRAYKQLGLNRRGDGTSPANRSCGIGSIKTNIGHLEPASGVASVIKVALAMRHRTLPATVHLNTLNPFIKLEDTPFFPVRRTQPWGTPSAANGTALPLRAGVSSFGFGGVNAHVILQEAPTRAARSRSARPIDAARIVVLSAKTRTALTASARRLVDWIHSAASRDVDLDDVAFTLQTGRVALTERLATVVGSVDQLAARLSEFLGAEACCPGVHLGSTAGAGPGPDPEREDPASAHRLEALIRDGAFDELARLWTHGLEIEWSRLQASDVRRIPLPTYPFARDRHWVATRRPASEASSATVPPNRADPAILEDVTYPTVAVHGPDVTRPLLQIMTATLGIDVALNDALRPFDELGIDSVARIPIVKAVLKAFEGLTSAADGDTLLRCASLAEMAVYIQNHPASAPGAPAAVDLDRVVVDWRNSQAEGMVGDLRVLERHPLAVEGRMIVDEGDPFFFDHPLDHVSAIHLAQAAGEAAMIAFLATPGQQLNTANSATAANSGAFVSGLAMRFRRLCAKSPAPTVRVTTAELSPGASIWPARVTLSQDGKPVADGRLEVAALVVEPASPPLPLGEPPEARPAIDKRTVNKERAENVFISEVFAPAGEAPGSWLLLPHDEHTLVRASHGQLDIVAIAEAARQCLRAFAAFNAPPTTDAPDLSRTAPFLESLAVTLRRPPRRAEAIFLQQRQFEVDEIGSNSRLELHGTILSGREEVGSFHIVALLLNKDVMRDFHKNSQLASLADGAPRRPIIVTSQ